MSNQHPLFDRPAATTISPPPPKPTEPAQFTPRPYQAQAVDRAFELLTDNAGVLFRLATGMGKTYTASLFASRWLAGGDNRKVLVLLHEIQLLNQWERELAKFTGKVIGVEQADRRVWKYSVPDIVIAMRQTLALRTDDEGNEHSRLFKFDPKFDWFVVADEAHRYTYEMPSVKHIWQHFEQNPRSRRAGLTATPERSDGVSLSTLFPAIAIDIRMTGSSDSAVANGYAVPFKQRYIKVDAINFKNIATVGKDFSEEELGAILEEQKTLVAVCKPMLDEVGDRLNLIFTVTVEQARLTAAYIRSKGGTAESISGETPQRKRDWVLKQFEDGKIQHLCVCGLCREGYDNPNIRAVTIFRPTKSRPLAEQMKGRGCRPLKGLLNGLETREERLAAIAASAKPDCLIIDLVGVTGLADCASTLDCYAEGLPDEVKERAQEKLEDGEEDIEKALAEAQDEIDEIKAKEEQERAQLTQEDMDRRAALEAEVEYTAFDVTQGHGAEFHRDDKQVEAANVKVKGGKYNGERIGGINSGHLQYLAKQKPNTEVGKAARAELAARGHDDVLRVWFGRYAGKKYSDLSDGQLRQMMRSPNPQNQAHAAMETKRRQRRKRA